MPGEVPPEQMRPGAIYNSNRFSRAMLLRLGCEVTDFGIVPDRREATIEALRQGSCYHDLILDQRWRECGRGRPHQARRGNRWAAWTCGKSP